MNRDNLLFAFAGVLLGFVAAYFLFETVARNQPARLPVADATAVGQAPGAAPAAAAAAQAPFMAQLAEAERFVEADPEDADARLRLANMYFDAGMWERAAGSYERFLELGSPTPDVLSDFGVSLYELRRFDEALAQFRQAQELSPEHWESRFNQVVVLAFGLERFDEAEAILDELRSMQPNNPQIEQLAANVAQRRAAA